MCKDDDEQCMPRMIFKARNFPVADGSHIPLSIPLPDVTVQQKPTAQDMPSTNEAIEPSPSESDPAYIKKTAIARAKRHQKKRKSSDIHGEFQQQKKRFSRTRNVPTIEISAVDGIEKDENAEHGMNGQLRRVSSRLAHSGSANKKDIGGNCS